MPFGYLIGTGLMAIYVVFALAPPKPRQTSPVRVSFWLGYLVNELPFLAFFILVASTALAVGQRDIATPVGWTGLGLAILATGGLVVIVRRALRTGAAVDEALIDAGLPPRSRRRLPIARILFWPFVFPHTGVERLSNIPYGDAGRANLLDVYRSRSGATSGPTLIHMHGGAFRDRERSCAPARLRGGGHLGDGRRLALRLLRPRPRCAAVLRCASGIAELPGAQHAFDYFYSIRFEAVIDGIEAFADWVLLRRS